MRWPLRLQPSPDTLALSSGRLVLIDPELGPGLALFNWYAQTDIRGYERIYRSFTKPNGGRYHYPLTHAVLGFPPLTLYPPHRIQVFFCDGNSFNCRADNLIAKELRAAKRFFRQRSRQHDLFTKPQLAFRPHTEDLQS